MNISPGEISPYIWKPIWAWIYDGGRLFRNFGIAHCKSPRILPSSVARAPFTDNSFSSRPRSASIVTSLSVTSTVPFIPELKNPILAMNEKKRVEPCQLLCSFAICSGRVLVPRKRSSNERSTARMTSSLDLLWETVTRTRAMPRPSLVSSSLSDRHLLCRVPEHAKIKMYGSSQTIGNAAFGTSQH